MSTFDVSASLLNSALLQRSSNVDDEEWESGIKKGRGPKQKCRRFRRFPPRKYQRSPDRAQSWMRRRRIGAKSVSMPSEICDLFSEGERSALNIIANVVREHGRCEWPLDKIAAIAGVCRCTVQNAVTKAKDACLIRVQLRPVPGPPKYHPHCIEDLEFVVAESGKFFSFGNRVQNVAPHG